MKRKDLLDIRKELKLGSYMMPIKEIYSVYLKKDNGELVTKEFNVFEMMDIEKQELYLNNFKKVLTGAIDSKIFELNFKDSDTHDILYKILNSNESSTVYVDKIVNKISENYTYDTDIVINFLKAEYYRGTKNRNAEESVDDYIQATEFILCSINKVDLPKKALKLDYSDLTFKTNSVLNMIINLKSPLDGFVFPSFSSQYSDTTKLVYYSSKAKQINNVFIEKVLGCKSKATAVEEKESFDTILNIVVGTDIKPGTMQEIYGRINKKLELEDDEEPTIDMKEIKDILNESGVENTESVKGAFEEICGGDYEFKVKNVVPDFRSKSMKMQNEDINITISPRNLNSVKQIRDKGGAKCLLIKLNEDIELNGFKLEMEENLL